MSIKLSLKYLDLIILCLDSESFKVTKKTQLQKNVLKIQSASFIINLSLKHTST